MDAPDKEAPESAGLTPWSQRDTWTIAGLILLTVILRGYLFCNTEVTARDSVGYIRYALQLEKKSWKDVLTHQHQHPGYPLAVLAASWPIRAFTGPPNPNNMRYAAQLASMVASVLLVIPLYALGRMLLGPAVAVLSVLMCQMLPVSSHHLGDGISEAVFLLMVVTALACGVAALRSGRLIGFARAGVATGLAYLVRPEGAMVLIALALALIVRQSASQWRQSWKHTALQFTLAVSCGLVIGSPYFLTTGRFTNKPTANAIIQGGEASRDEAGYRPLFASLFAATTHRHEQPVRRAMASARMLGTEITHILHYTGVVALIIGLVAVLPGLLRQREAYLPLILTGLQIGLVLALGWTVGYISDRHLMVPLITLAILSAAGIKVFGEALAKQISWMRPSWPAIAFLLGCLPGMLQPLHANRHGNHVAGLWLAQQVVDGDVVVDDHAWSHYYSGLMFDEGKTPVLPADYIPRSYWVMTRSKDQIVDKQRREQENVWKAKAAKLVYHWPENVDADLARVVIYSLDRDPILHPWTKAAPVNPPAGTSTSLRPDGGP